jgi:hypothetical protein
VNVSVRQVRDGDEEQIAEVWTEAYCGPGPGERATPYVLADVQEVTEVGRLLVAAEGEAVVGAVVFYPPGMGRGIPQEGEAELSRLYESLGFHRVPGRDLGDVEGPKLVFRLALPPDG